VDRDAPAAGFQIQGFDSAKVFDNPCKHFFGEPTMSAVRISSLARIAGAFSGYADLQNAVSNLV
jgi:hypothetical protein